MSTHHLNSEHPRLDGIPHEPDILQVRKGSLVSMMLCMHAEQLVVHQCDSPELGNSLQHLPTGSVLWRERLNRATF
jgi:hypothetical protein